MADAGINEVLGDTANDDYHVMASRLRAAALEVASAGADEDAADLRAVEQVCSLQSTPQLDPPYRALISFGSHHSGDLASLSTDTVARLIRMLPAITAPLVRGRIADVLWLLTDKSIRFGFAQEALAAFQRCDFGEAQWFITGEETARRAVGLAKSLGGSGRGVLANLRNQLSKAALGSDATSYYVLRVTEVLQQARLSSEQAAQIAERLEAAAQAAGGEVEFQRAVDYASAAARWWASADDLRRAAGAQALSGTLLIAMAASRGTGTTGGANLAGSVVLNRALKALRAVPRQYRPPLGVDQQIADVLVLLRTAGELSVTEMHAFTSGPIDLSEAAEQAQAAVRGKDFLEALAGFCRIMPFADAAAARISVEEELQAHPLQTLFGTTHLSHDGRTTRKVPPLGPVGSQEYENAVWAQMVKHHGYRVSLTVYGMIAPILDVFLDEQVAGMPEFLEITRRSSVVPVQNEVAFAVGLAAGMRGDWLTAINVLAPQVENMVRQLLKQRGVQTSLVEEDETESEVSLSSLLANPAAESFFGADLVYELKAVFTDALGPNLRNDVAHGLLVDAAAYGPSVVYAWWLVLKIVYSPVYFAMQLPDDEGEPTETNRLD